MGQLTLIERVRRAIGHVAWKVFIWAEWHGDEFAFNEARDEEVYNH